MTDAVKNPGDSARSVLVIKLSALGDFMLALGAMRAVREAHPSARITLLTTPPFEEFAKASPYFDVVETDGRPADARATASLIRRLRNAGHDIVYDFQTSGRTKNYFAALKPNPPLWSGHANGCAFFHDNPERGSMHTIDRLAEQLDIAGIGPEGGYSRTGPPMPDLSWIKPALRNPPRLQPAFFSLNEPYMLMIPGSSAHRDAKRWPVDHYTQLARRIASDGITPVVIGGKDESEVGAAVARAEPKAKNLVTRTNLFQISTLAETALFAVGNDTGPMHMATLTGAPGVALFATDESDPDHSRPRGSNVVVVHAPRLEFVSVGDVYQACQSLAEYQTFMASKDDLSA